MGEEKQHHQYCVDVDTKDNNYTTERERIEIMQIKIKDSLGNDVEYSYKGNAAGNRTIIHIYTHTHTKKKRKKSALSYCFHDIFFLYGGMRSKRKLLERSILYRFCYSEDANNL